MPFPHRHKKDAVISNEDFVKEWQAGGTAREVGKRLGMPAQTVHKRYHRLKSKGVPLRSPQCVNYEALAALARSLGPGSRK